jgi:peptide chain release factor subunit 1
MRVSAELLRDLARLSQTDRTVLSAYVSLAQGWDGVKQFLIREHKRLQPVLSTDEKDLFETSLSFLEDYIKERKSQNFHGPGLAFFADLGADYMQGVELTVAPTAFVAVDNEAIIHPLALELDEYEPIGVIMIDASCTRILIAAGSVLDDMDALCTKIHHLSKVGGWSQMRYQRRRQKQVQHFARDVIEKATDAFNDAGVKRVVIAGRDRMITALEQELPRVWQNRVIATVRWDLADKDRTFLEKIRPILEQAERDQEKTLLDQLIGELRRGGLAVAGINDTVQALERAQVDTLFVSSGMDKEMCEKLVSRAEATGAYVEFIPKNEVISTLGGVGALLRFRI